MPSTNPSSAYFAWRYYHPHESEDPQAIWGAAWRAGGRAALNDSSRLVELVPLLRELLYALEDGRVEVEFGDVARTHYPLWSHGDKELDCEVSW